MEYPQCTVANLALPFQIAFNLLSFIFALITIVLIIKQKLYHNSFTFLLLITQFCYLLISSIDLLTKITTYSNAYIKWCQIVSPFIYGTITSSFLLIELFVVMVYKTILDGEQGWLYRNIKIITFGIVVVSISINCVGIPFYGLGFCDSCGFEKNNNNTIYADIVYAIILADYYFPMILMVPVFALIFHLICKKKRTLFNQSQSSDLGCKILTIPVINFVILSVSGTTGYIPNPSPLLYTFLFECIYLVSIINFIFYMCFIKFFELDDQEKSRECCCGKSCWKEDKIYRDTQLTYFYDDKKSTYE